MKEPTRPIHQPTVEADGSLVAHTVATPTSFKVRARVTIGSRKVIPVIFVPGIMGSNLRVRQDVDASEDGAIKPGMAAWRPPNGPYDSYREAAVWAGRPPKDRQKILDAHVLEVDPDGELDYPLASLDDKLRHERGWGEVHASSYGSLLVDLQRHLDKTFQVSPHGIRKVRQYWRRVMQCEPERWGARTVATVTEAELEKYAGFQYPVYAFGYNWLESGAVSARRLRERIDAIKKFWTDRKHECRKVILVTHSMGGLVARACARLSESGGSGTSDIAGIVHAVMPALGAPVAYRRIACGTEGSQYTNGPFDNFKAWKFSQVAGLTSAETTPIMATAPGVLQLLPNQHYPRPWISIKTLRKVNQEDQVRDLLALPDGNPYDFYRDMSSWYRMIDPRLADPALAHKDNPNGIKPLVIAAIDEAERFHTHDLMIGGGKGASSMPYYHPNTYAFYGADASLKAYGQVRWAARETGVAGVALTPANIRGARPVSTADDGSREVEVAKGLRLRFMMWPQDAHGDETVPVVSAAAVEKHARAIFSPKGFRHQDSFQQEDMLLLTRHLIVKIVQDVT
ncbi:triacylglycerol lipase [Massilia sp. YIM B02443]|uniref:esterase/lipase family protein n=1 Tax=Massilia sp. YIM B02443 TaxID=3050127 RepID=UPI0025B6C3E2|nr:alpha/beta fold hydrolase [Massilia sp. YIM B02443]MDN4039897.1 alpha/beta fold hydrolase [Massilia sp. YIM B02443]